MIFNVDNPSANYCRFSVARSRNILETIKGLNFYPAISGTFLTACKLNISAFKSIHFAYVVLLEV